MDMAIATRVAYITARLTGRKVIFGSWKDYQELADAWATTDYDTNTKTPPKDFPEWHEVLFASYGGGSYEGDATVIFVKDGKLYENHDSHCSCNGLENWSPEETTVEALAMRERKGPLSSYHFLHDHEEEAVEAYWRLVDNMVFAQNN